MPPAARFPDASASQAVLVGVSRYHRMGPERQLPAVEENLRRLDALLGDPRIWGLPSANRTVLHQPSDGDQIINAISTAAERCKDTLLVYYTGHGLTDPLVDQDLYLALPTTREPRGTHLALGYKHIRSTLLRAATVPRKAVILDCCWSGKVLREMGGEDMAAQAAIEGTAVLTASAATRKALSPENEPCTAFTGALTDVLGNGLPGGPEFLDISTLYLHLHARLGSSARPLPQLGVSGAGAEIVLARNTAWTGQSRTGAPPEKSPHTPRGREQAPPVDTEALHTRIEELLRTGRYADAQALLLSAAETGETRSVTALVTGLRRAGHYREAALLERAALTGAEAVRDLLRRRRWDGS